MRAYGRRMSISTAPALPVPTIEATRRLALTGLAGASLTTIGGVVVQAIVQPSSTVSEKMWSYPWTSSALVAVSIVQALLHVLVLAGVVALARSGVAGPTRIARAGLAIAVAGTVLLAAGELASIPARHARDTATGATAVGVVFGLAVLLSAVGFLLVGLQTLRAGQWRDWRRFTPLATGIWCVALLGVNVSNALPTGVAIYGVCLFAMCFALCTGPAPTARS